MRARLTIGLQARQGTIWISSFCQCVLAADCSCQGRPIVPVVLPPGTVLYWLQGLYGDGTLAVSLFEIPAYNGAAVADHHSLVGRLDPRRKTATFRGQKECNMSIRKRSHCDHANVQNSEKCSCQTGHGIPPIPDAVTQQLWTTLEQRLLSIGGKRVVWWGPSVHLPAIVARGKLFNQPVKKRKMSNNQCHTNAASLWGDAVKATTIATGYCLSWDGLWRQHSWAIRGKHVVETTVSRSRYYGIELSENEAFSFWVDTFVRVKFPEPDSGLDEYLSSRRDLARLFNDFVATLSE